MVEIVQTLMSVPVLKQTIVTPTPCVPTPKDPMFVAVLKVLRVTAKRAQPLYLRVRHLAVRTPFAKKKVNFLFVFVMSVSKVTDTNALILTSVKLKHTSVTSTPFVSTRKDLIYVAVKRDIVATATPAQLFYPAVLHHVAQTHFVRKGMDSLNAFVVLVT